MPIPVSSEFYHATLSELQAGDLLVPGYLPDGNFAESTGEHVHFTPSQLNVMYYHYLLHELYRELPWVYIVEPTGEYEPDPEDSEAYRSTSPVRILAAWMEGGLPRRRRGVSDAEPPASAR
jgi:Rifampin ADP-ribosyl transferase